MNRLDFANKQLMCSGHDAVHNAALNADRAVGEDGRIDTFAIFPFQAESFKFVLIFTRNRAEIGVFFLKTLFRQVDDKAAILFYHVMRIAGRNDAYHDHSRVKTDICRETNGQCIVPSFFVPAGYDGLRNRPKA